MTFYIRVPPVVPGTTVRGRIERVAARDNAAEVGRSEAEEHRIEAFVRWPELDWQIEAAGEGKYVIVGARSVG
jgi:acyl dehydratase